MFTIQIYVVAFISFVIGGGIGLVCAALLHAAHTEEGDNA